MPESIKQIGGLITQYGMEIILFIVGALGAAQRPSIMDHKLTKKQRTFAILMGGITSVLLTQFTVFLFSNVLTIEISKNFYPAIGYFLGHWGLNQVSSIMLKFINRKKH